MSDDRAGKMTKKYMNRVFMETFEENFDKTSSEMRTLPTEYWLLNEKVSRKIRQHRNEGQPFFNAEEQA